MVFWLLKTALFLFLTEGHLKPSWCDNAGSTQIPDVLRSHETRPEDRFGNITTGNAVVVDSVVNDTFPRNHITKTVCENTETQIMLSCNTNIATTIEMVSDPNDVKEKADFDLLFIIPCIVLPVICVPGCMLNVLNIYVLAKQSKATTNNCLLIGLSVADLSYLLCILIVSAYSILEKLNYPLYIRAVTSARLDWNGYFTSLVTGRSSNAFIIILSLERFIAVKFPLTAKSSWLSRHPSKILASVFAFVTVLLLPNLFRVEFVKGFDPVSNQSFVSRKLTHFAEKNPEFYTVYTYVILVVLRLVPVLSVVVLNIAIIVTLKFSRKSWNSSQISDDKRRAKELKVTRMLVTIALLFVVCDLLWLGGKSAPVEETVHFKKRN
ncbi:probable G-protein coupled receptor B0563.6 [Liolophura sinensis]|uniref:probable G-protein coupled receptor B0563.6 n=1 Tax=Liolophura sinensis TaxID=3198878 RepID=UPI003158D205